MKRLLSSQTTLVLLLKAGIFVQYQCWNLQNVQLMFKSRYIGWDACYYIVYFSNRIYMIPVRFPGEWTGNHTFLCDKTWVDSKMVIYIRTKSSIKMLRIIYYPKKHNMPSLNGFKVSYSISIKVIIWEALTHYCCIQLIQLFVSLMLNIQYV